MCTWLLQHGVLVNATKTELLMCGNRHQLSQITESPTISFMDHTLTCSNRAKNLGMIMDPTLSWEIHIHHVIGHCFGILIGLQNAKHLLPQGLFPRIIDGLVFSHIRYCAQVYCGRNRTPSKSYRIFLTSLLKLSQGAADQTTSRLANRAHRADAPAPPVLLRAQSPPQLLARRAAPAARGGGPVRGLQPLCASQSTRGSPVQRASLSAWTSAPPSSRYADGPTSSAIL